MSIQASTQLRAAPDVLTARCDGAAVLLDFRSETFLGLDDTASAIWSVLERGGSLDSIVERLEQEFTAERDELERDARAFVSQLVARRLVVAA